MHDALLDLPFDHYERHTITREVANRLRDYTSRRSLRVIDVGGAASSLAHFLPADDVLAMDLDRSSGGDYVQGSGVELPFRDGAFNLASCHDTLEHVPAPLRERFIGEMARVATDAVVVQGPFNEPGVPEAERVVMKIASDLYGADCSTVKFLTEHAECGLPDLRETVSQLESAGFRSIVVPNGALDEWIVKMLVKHHASKLAPLGLHANEFDRWSNRTFLPGTDERPTYRYAIVAVRAGEERLLHLLEEAFRVPPRRSDEDAITLPLSAVRPSVATLANLAHDRLVELTDELKAIPLLQGDIARLEGAVRDRDAVMHEQEEVLLLRAQEIDDLAQQLAAIHSSTGYRVLKGYRGVTRALFPPGSVRGMPYRLTVRVVKAGMRAPVRVYRTAGRGMRARKRLGTAGVLGKGIEGLRTRGKWFDAMKYALAVDWREEIAKTPRLGPRPDGPITINWVVPPISEGGGLRTIFRFVEHFNTLGYEQRVYEMPVHRIPRGSAEEVRALIRRNYGVALRDVSLDFENMAPSDFTISTSWHTAYAAVKQHNARHKLYFVQDFEPAFAPMGTESVLAENTYRFGFHGLTAGRWLSDRLTAEFGMACDAFELAVDPGAYFPNDAGPRKKVFYYSRPATPRRGFELGIAALAEFHRRHPQYEIVLAGGEMPGHDLPFPAKTLGYLTEDELNTLYNQCAAALVISLTNCSLLPIEIMATGTPVVTNAGDNNAKLLPEGSAILEIPTPVHLADGLARAVEYTDRARLVKRATAATWQEQTSKIAAVLESMLESDG